MFFGARTSFLEHLTNIFFWLFTARFNPDSRGRSVAHIGKVVPSPNESASRESNTLFHPYGGCSPLSISTVGDLLLHDLDAECAVTSSTLFFVDSN